MSKAHFSDYDETTTGRCERVLVTLLGDLGPWRERVYLAGGLAPRYLIGELPKGVRAHVGTTDVDLVIGLALGDETPQTYRTLETNLRNSSFTQDGPSFRWKRHVEGIPVTVEFLCETDKVESGHIFRPKGQSTGSGLGAFNVRGAQLVTLDYIERKIKAERLAEGGVSQVTVRIANLLPYVVLKILAFQDRHENKDAYDLIFCILYFGRGPHHAGTESATSPIARHPDVREAMRLLRERFESITQDGPVSYGTFLAETGDPDEVMRLRREAVATVREYLEAFGIA